MQAIQVYGCFYIQFPKFTYLRMGGYSSEPLKFPRYRLDPIVLSEMCRQFVSVVESFEITKRSSSIFFPIEISHYRCPNLKQAMLIREALTWLCLKLFSPREILDYTGFIGNNLKNAISFIHISQLEDHWENCPSEFEVGKRLWLRLTIKQINMFNVDLGTYGLKEEDSEEVIDPFYIDQVECMPIPKID